MKIYVILALTAVILVAGCIEIPDFFGGNVIKVQRSENFDSVKDVISVKNIQTIPTSPILPDTPVVFSYILVNNDDSRVANSVKTDLYDAPTFKNLADERLCNSGACLPSNCGEQGCNIIPGEERLITYELKSPSESEIVDIKTEPTMNFRVSYDFQSELSYILPVVDFDEIITRQRSGEPVTVAVAKSHGPGPVQIDAELQGSEYILANYEAGINFKIKNVGRGFVQDNKIEKDKMVILFPADLNVKPSAGASEIFSCGENIAFDYEGNIWQIAARLFNINQEELNTGFTKCINNKGDIEIFKDETRVSMRFDIGLSNPDSFNVPFRSYTITSVVDYRYEIRDSTKVTINPFGNR